MFFKRLFAFTTATTNATVVPAKAGTRATALSR